MNDKNKSYIPIIGFMTVHNGADFVEQSIRSALPILDRLIIIEGAWGENLIVNNEPRSTDVTIDLITKIQSEFPDKIEIYYHNDRNQLVQRNRIFQYINNNNCWLMIIDHDEVWTHDQLAQAYKLLQKTKNEAIKVHSLTFINDPYTYSPIAFPRFFRIKPNNCYHFCSPNDIVCNNKQLKVVNEDIYFYHYSYCHNNNRFIQKKKERTRIHGHFPWDLKDGQVVRPDANILYYDQEHPDIMKHHPLMNKKPNRNGDHYVIIQHSGIGNLIHLTPLCKALRIMNPLCKITILTWKRSARILEGWHVVDEVSTEDPNVYFANLKSPVKEIMVSPIGCLPLGPHILNESIMRLEIKPPWEMHEVEYHMLFAEELGWNDNVPESEIYISKKNKTKASNKILNELISEPFLAVNACYLKSDHWPKKHWGNLNYANLLTWFSNEYSWPIVFVGSKDDRRDSQEIIRLIDKLSDTPVQDMYNFCGWSNDIKDTAAILKKATLTLGNDGGLQHISTAVGTPTVTIFTFTNHVKNAPRHPKSRIAMKQCDNRLMCQHGGHSNCQCLDVPVHLVKKEIKDLINDLD